MVSTRSSVIVVAKLASAASVSRLLERSCDALVSSIIELLLSPKAGRPGKGIAVLMANYVDSCYGNRSSSKDRFKVNTSGTGYEKPFSGVWT